MISHSTPIPNSYLNKGQQPKQNIFKSRHVANMEEESIHPLELVPGDKAVAVPVNPSKCSLLV